MKREIQKIPTSDFESQIAQQPFAQLFPKISETLLLSQGFLMPIFKKFGEESSVRQRRSGTSNEAEERWIFDEFWLGTLGWACEARDRASYYITQLDFIFAWFWIGCQFIKLLQVFKKGSGT
jgi:hypothetical protein